MDYPAQIQIDTPEKLSRWRVFQGILTVPHMVVLYGLMIAASVVVVLSWFAIVFTGRMPEGFANFLCMTQRYSARVNSYSYFLIDQYPPFDFTTTPADPGGSPTRVDFRPALGGRNRLTVALRFLWAIPALFLLYIVMLVAMIMLFLAFFAVLFTGRWPATFRDWMLKMLRANVRLGAYLGLLTDDYPPNPFSA